MKKELFKVLLCMSCLASLNSAYAATQVAYRDGPNYQRIKAISVSGCRTAEEAIKAIRKCADDEMADYYHISRLDTPGQGSRWSANAVLYSKQLNPKR